MYPVKKSTKREFPITITKSREVWFPIHFLHILHRKFSNQHEYCRTNVIGRSWRTWKTNQITLKYLTTGKMVVGRPIVYKCLHSKARKLGLSRRLQGRSWVGVPMKNWSELEAGDPTVTRCFHRSIDGCKRIWKGGGQAGHFVLTHEPNCFAHHEGYMRVMSGMNTPHATQ